MPEYLPFGPRDRQVVLHFMALTLTSRQAASPDAVTRLVGMCKRGIDVFTDYSGLGMPDHVFNMLRCELLKQYPHEVTSLECVRLLRASDVDEVCKTVLCRSVPGPQCVLGNILARAPEPLLSKIKDMWSEANREFQAKLAQGEDRRELVDILGQEMAVTAGDAVREDVFGAGSDRAAAGELMAYCFKHQRMCQIFPGQDERKITGRCAVAVAGMTCADWSSRGPRLGFFGDSFLAWIFWVREMLILMPVLIIGECTIHFNHQAFAGIVRGYYELGAAIFSPSDVGLK